ncbi:MAG: uroporphyrinogen-III synthase [Alphaproteobacteria bacterium]|nr:uroporphyrinogen-III synthase [Alphaproteobacteria bacterium]
MRVLVTRPEGDAARTADLLRALGHEPVVMPLLDTRFRDGPEIALDGVQAILATSANGVRALMRRTPRRDVPVFAVGPQTAEAARDFAIVRNADGDARTLADAARRWADPKAGPLLHVKGAEGTSGLDLPGFDLRSIVLYDVVPIDAPIPLDGIDAALFFSPRSARVFAQAAGDTAGVIAVCISEATAKALAPLVFREVRVAAKPNQSALLEKLL